MTAAALLLAVAFGFPNEQGTRLLATGEIAKPEALRTGRLETLAARKHRIHDCRPKSSVRWSAAGRSRSQLRVFRSQSLKRGTSYLLASDWKGAEGSALPVHVAEGGGQFEELISDSWYRSPL
jgi:hypothetical protein